MFRKTALGIASAAVITVAALSGTASSAQAGSFGFSWGGGGAVVHFGGGYGGHGWGNPCWKYKKKWYKTGNPKWKWKYKKCLHWYY